jgi:serine/threonine protein kinase
LALRHGARGCVTRHAIKLFDPSIYPDAATYWMDMGRLASQTSSMQSIHSPNLVARETYDETDGIGYTQMEVIHGTDLGQFLSGAHLDRVRTQLPHRQWERLYDVLFRRQDDCLRIQPGIVVYIMRMLLRGLEWLHNKGFVHGDVKPSNIMLDRLGYVKLIDYGRAARANERTKVLFGSPLYMAPEVHRRRPILIQSDLYSVGLVGMVMLVGKRLLFERHMTEGQLVDFKLTLPGRLSEFLPPYVLENERLVAVLRRFLSPRPEDRFPNAQIAESDAEGLREVHKQLMHTGKDSDYLREVSHFVNRIQLDCWETVTLNI